MFDLNRDVSVGDCNAWPRKTFCLNFLFLYFGCSWSQCGFFWVSPSPYRQPPVSWARNRPELARMANPFSTDPSWRNARKVRRWAASEEKARRTSWLLVNFKFVDQQSDARGGILCFFFSWSHPINPKLGIMLNNFLPCLYLTTFSGISHMQWGGHNYFLSWREPWHKFEDWDWFNGRNFCRDRCMDLVSFETPGEFRLFSAIARQGQCLEKYNNRKNCIHFLIHVHAFQIYDRAAASSSFE